MTESQAWIAIGWLAVIAIVGEGSGWLALLGFVGFIVSAVVTEYAFKRWRR